MTKSDDLKNKFIIDENQFNKKVIEEYTEKVLKFAKISNKGDILIENNNLSPDDKLRLCLLVKFIGHSWNEQIPETFTLSEAVKILPNERREAIGSRLSNLTKRGFAQNVSRGEYKVYSHKIGSFIDSLKDGVYISDSKGKKGMSQVRKSKRVSGIGRYIFELINNNFFDTPKTIKEVEEELKIKGHLYDSRVIDATIRNVFMKSKKIITRLKNTGDSKARWRYVKRS